MVHMCKVITSTGFFFHFLKILIFWIFRGVKGQKMVQNEETLCLLYSIFQETYIIWFPFMVHMCKMIISTSIFSKFWLSGLLGGSKGKKWCKMGKNYVCCDPHLKNHTSYDFHFLSQMTKNQVCHIPYLRKHTYDCDLWYTCVKWWHLKVLFSLF